jgi:hypothetical protein
MFGLMLGQVNYSDGGPSEITAARTSTAPILGTNPQVQRTTLQATRVAQPSGWHLQHMLC